MYSYIGFELIVNIDSDNQKQIVILSKDDYDDKKPTTGFSGYTGFYSQIEFDMSGKFLEQGFWE